MDQHQFLPRVGLQPLLPAVVPASQAAQRRGAGGDEFGQQNAKRWLTLLNDYWIGPNKTYLVGNTITIADYFGAGIVTLGETIGVDFAPYPNVTRWLAAMKKGPNWGKINEAFDGLREAVKGQKFVTLA